MASPLTMYVPIKQDESTQALAKLAVENFTKGVQSGLDETKIVHYATLVLIPNTSGEGALGILLTTRFDKAMIPYLETFWGSAEITEAITGLASIALNPPTLPIDTFDKFANFINDTNLTPAPEDLVWKNFYQAYTKTVEQILS
ncbi:MAG: hypothetical protein JXR05_04405 [Flavobacteriaceae bacterium]